MVFLAIIIGLVATAASLRLAGAAINALQGTPWQTLRYASVVMPLLSMLATLSGLFFVKRRERSVALSDT